MVGYSMVDPPRDEFSSQEPRPSGKGDEERMRALMEDHLPQLRAFVRLRTGRALLAKDSLSDLVQSTCREVIEDLPTATLTTKRAFLHWLYKAAERKIVDRARYWGRAKRDPGKLAEFDDFEGLDQVYNRLGTPSRIASGREELERFEQTFAKLPEDYQVVILLHRVVGLPHAEVSREMNRSENAVRSLLFRALAHLSTLLEAK